MKSIIHTFLVLWQFPQVLAGLVTVWLARAKKVLPGVWLAQAKWFVGSISLSEYFRVFDRVRFAEPESHKHELGHAKQSRILGPFYLFVTGIPSIIHAAKSKGKTDEEYHKFWTERWAEKLGGNENV